MSDELNNEDLDIEELKAEASDLGLKHNVNISAVKLKAKIEAYYESQETSGPAVSNLVKAAEVTAKDHGFSDPKKEKIRLRKKEASKTRVVTIIDNDQRQNNHTTTCLVNCSNQYFDLGTRVLPLGEKIEVAKGHIDVLKEVIIPNHTRGPKGLSVTKTRPRYSISYEDMQ